MNDETNVFDGFDRMERKAAAVQRDGRGLTEAVAATVRKYAQWQLIISICARLLAR